MDNKIRRYVGIVQEFQTIMNFGDFPVNNGNPQFTKTRILLVRFCSSYMRGFEYITRNQFMDFFISLPNAFVIIIRCENKNNQLVFDDISEVLNLRFYSINRPIIIFFESPNSWKILYKIYGINQQFKEIEESMDVEAQQVENFCSLMINLQNGGYGFFNGQLMQTTLNRSVNAEIIERNTIEDLMETLADRNEFLCVRFLHLFDSNLKPNTRIIQRVLRDDFLSNNADRFAAIYGHDFQVSIPAGYNLLMLAIAHKNADAAEILIQSGINLNAICNHINAADLACQTGQFNILRILIRFNSQYPHNFNIQNVHLAEICDIQDRTRIIHNAIRDADEEDDFDATKEIIMDAFSIFPNLKYWYDSANQSAVTHAIFWRKFRTYRILLQIGLCFGPYEDIAVIKQGLTQSEQQSVANINTEIAQNLPRDYLLNLRTNSLDWQHNPDHENHVDKIDDAFKILDENEFIQPILQIVAASRDFRIIFDFNRTSVEAVDFTSHGQTEGVFQTVQASNFHIYIGARDLMEAETMNRTIGTLAHELCHFAMLLTYNNICNPYENCDNEARDAFGAMTQRCLRISRDGNVIEREEIVELVGRYHISRQHAEMITRVPHMMMHYRDSPRLEQVRTIYNDLFTDYTTRVIPNVMGKISQVRDNFYESIRLEHTYWTRRAKKEKIIRYSLMSAVLMAIIIVIGLAVVFAKLMGCKSNLNNDCPWDKLNKWEQIEILKTVVDFQGHNVTIKDLTNENNEILSKLNNHENRNAKKIKLNRRKWRLTFEYFGRQFTKPNEDYMNFGSSNDTEETCVYKYSVVYCFDYILNLLKNRAYFILTGEPLSGKTTELLRFEEEAASNNSVIWVSYLNFTGFIVDDYTEIADWTVTNLTNFLLDVQDIKESAFEKEIFKGKFLNGDVILFIDHIDTLFIKNETFAENFLKILLQNSHKNTKLWFGTRTLYSNKIKEIIKVYDENFQSIYKLLPLYCHDREKYLSNILKATVLDGEQVNLTLKRIKNTLEHLEIWRNNRKPHIDNIYLLKIVANHTADAVLNNETSMNFYWTLNEYIKKAEGFNTSYKEPPDANRDIFAKSIALHKLKNVEVIFDKVNMNVLIDDFANENYIYHAPNASIDISTISLKVINEKLESGFFKKENGNLEFLSLIYFEYFVARYIADDFWNQIPKADADNDVFKNKIILLLSIFKDLGHNFPVIGRCVKDYAKMKRIDFKQTFKHVFRETYKKFLNGTNLEVGKEMIELFENDTEMLKILKEK